jgi:hypothetical protein
MHQSNNSHSARRVAVASAIIWLLAVSQPGRAHAQKEAAAAKTRIDELIVLPFEENRPTSETARKLRDELLFQRATQAYLWALPLINTLGMKLGSEKIFGAGYNVLRSGRTDLTPRLWSRRPIPTSYTP